MFPYLWFIFYFFIATTLFQSFNHLNNTNRKTVKLGLKKLKRNGKILVDGSCLAAGRTYVNPFCEEFVLLATYVFEVLDYAVMKYELREQVIPTRIYLHIIIIITNIIFLIIPGMLVS
jgi:hypothetical protein